MNYKSLPAILLILLLFGCGTFTSSRTCEEIAATELRELLRQPESREKTRTAIAKVYDLPLERVDASSGGFGWSKDDVIGNFTIRDDAPTYASLNYRNRQPSVDEVIRCLGRPDLYWAWYSYAPGDTHRLNFELYYRDQGIAALVQIVGTGNEPPHLDGGTELVHFSFFPPSSSERMIERMGEGHGSLWWQQIKPWPDNIKDIVIGKDASLAQ